MLRRKRERGQTTIEYILVASVMAVLALTILSLVKGNFQTLARTLVWRIAQPCADCRDAWPGETPP